MKKYKVTRTATPGEKAAYGIDTITVEVKSRAMALIMIDGDPNGSIAVNSENIEAVEALEEEDVEYLLVTEEF